MSTICSDKKYLLDKSFELRPMTSSVTVLSLLEFVPVTPTNTLPLLDVAICSPSRDIFGLHSSSTEWKLPPAFLEHASLKEDLNLCLVHHCTDYQICHAINTKANGLDVKHLIREKCFYTSSPALVKKDSSLPGIVNPI